MYWILLELFYVGGLKRFVFRKLGKREGQQQLNIIFNSILWSTLKSLID